MLILNLNFMKKNKKSLDSQYLIQSQFDIMDSLTLLLNKSSLSNAVQEYCSTALKVIGVMYTDMIYGTGTKLLSKKKFDKFFMSLPTAYFINRELISIDTLTKNIRKCIETNEVVNMGKESTRP